MKAVPVAALWASNHPTFFPCTAFGVAADGEFDFDTNFPLTALRVDLLLTRNVPFATLRTVVLDVDFMEDTSCCSSLAVRTLRQSLAGDPLEFCRPLGRQG